MNLATPMPAQASASSSSATPYGIAMRAAMGRLAQDPRVVFMGQAVAKPGTFMSATFEGLERDRLLELPVCEEMQMGMAIGMALAGHVPVCVYPRWNFLLLAANQLVNHLDKLPLISGYRPHVIIRVAVGPESPVYPGLQHVGDFTDAFRSLLRTVVIEELAFAEDIAPAYEAALERPGATILVEYGDLYHG